MSDISDRKKRHLDYIINHSCPSYSCFDDYKFEHIALPEIDFNQIDMGVKFLGRKLAAPLIISSITGGIDAGHKINQAFAEMAQDYQIGFCVGSQRIAIDDSAQEIFFKVRDVAPNILLLSNLGAVQLNYGYGVDECKRAVDMIDADGLVLHINSLQEVFQPDGNTDFSNLLNKIEKVCKNLEVPVIVKEIGYGISAEIAKKLYNSGVQYIDVAGSGSISWPTAEQIRDVVYEEASHVFANWFNDTMTCISDIQAMNSEITIIGSGGIRNGLDVAKAISAGASICGIASSILRRLMQSRSSCENFMEAMLLELKVAMFCTGSKNIHALKSAQLYRVR